MVLSMLAVRRLAWPGHHCTLYTCTLQSAQPGLVLSIVLSTQCQYSQYSSLTQPSCPASTLSTPSPLCCPCKFYLNLDI